MKTAKLVLALLLCACSNKATTPDMGGPPPPAPPLAMACSDKLADIYTLPTGLPAYDSTHRGDVVRCAPDSYLSAQQINALLPLYGYKGAAVKSGFWTWKLTFRTERVKADGAPASAPNPEGASAALLLVPDHAVKNGPLVVFAHGSVGIGDSCAPSLFDLSTKVTAADAHDFPVNLMTLAGYGYTVIMPDYAGFGFNAAPGYFDASDEMHGVIDAARAAAHVLPAAAQVVSPLQIAIVGHSQGGHAALATQALSANYGTLPGKIIGVAVYAPFWTTMAAWGAITTPLGNFSTKTSSTEILFAMQYFYSAGELLDGPGGGVAMYQPSFQAAAKQTLLSPACFDAAMLQQMGKTPSDFFDAAFVQQVGNECSVGGACDGPLAAKWQPRWTTDRPPLDPNGAPVEIWYGANDTFVKPAFAQCARDKFAKDGAASLVSVCYDPTSTHGELVRVDGDQVNAWIAARAGLASEPPACTPFPSQTCQQPPDNDL